MKITELVEKIKYNAQCYYEGHPEISDDEFDALVEELHCVDPDNYILFTTGWGYNPSGKKVKHIYGGMDSIHRKPRHISNIPDNFNAIRLTPKFDGISGAAYYKNGKFYLGLTRGNGSIGVDCTDKMSRILKESSKEISNFTGAIRGEFIMTNENWELYKELHPDAKSQRNVVAGIINRNDVDEDIKYVDFIVYKIIAQENDRYQYESAFSVSCFLDAYFNESSSEHTIADKLDLSQELLEDIFNDYKQKYPCDGIVITSNNIVVKDSKFIYDEVAYKFNSNTESTEVLNIDWNRTRTGKMIPTIVFKPIDLDGATIRRCAGFNAKFIKDNGIGVGAEITIMRSGGVIPDLQEVINSVEPNLPEVCPCCGGKLEWSGVDLICNNTSCSGSDEADLFAWIYAIAPVHGLGYNTIKSFLDSTQIETIEDIYLRNLILDGSSATAKKLAEMWKKLREDSVDSTAALVALNIPRLGWKSATKISEATGLVRRIINQAEFEKRLSIQAQEEIRNLVGSATLESIKNNFDKFERLRFLKDRINYDTKSEVITIKAKGEVVITGKLNTCKRSEFEKIIINAGYSLAPAVKKGVLYLITNTPDSGSSKNRKADELGIKKITEEEFLEMIK